MTLNYEERYSATEIARRIQDIARRIEQDYAQGDLVLICILKGAACFIADLGRAMQRPVRMEYIDVIRSQAGAGEDEIVDFHFLTKFTVAGADLIVLKDVIRTGVIESYLLDQLREERPRSIRFACLVDRPQERKSSFLADYVLFPSEQGLLVGYGMEYQGRGGNYPFIAQVRTETGEVFDPPTGRIRIEPHRPPQT
jgi:hypoxanthine phosphoribosyltransferase